jgi:hypothetical protein
MKAKYLKGIIGNTYIKAVLLTPISLLIAYTLFLLFKESGGVLSDVGFVIILPIAIIGYSRHIIPELLQWPLFIVLQYVYILLILILYIKWKHFRNIKNSSTMNKDA